MLHNNLQEFVNYFEVSLKDTEESFVPLEGKMTFLVTWTFFFWGGDRFL